MHSYFIFVCFVLFCYMWFVYYRYLYRIHMLLYLIFVCIKVIHFSNICWNSIPKQWTFGDNVIKEKQSALHQKKIKKSCIKNNNWSIWIKGTISHIKLSFWTVLELNMQSTCYYAYGNFTALNLPKDQMKG
jgi:hypothetical protein